LLTKESKINDTNYLYILSYQLLRHNEHKSVSSMAMSLKVYSTMTKISRSNVSKEVDINAKMHIHLETDNLSPYMVISGTYHHRHHKRNTISLITMDK